MLLGILALLEARRLYTLRTTTVAGAVVGDDTFPMIVGLAFVLLGATAIVVAKLPSVRVSFPQGAVRHRMLGGAAVLIAYCTLVPYLGYTGSTAAGSAALLRAMGGYRWTTCLLLGGVATGVLYLLFRVWLLQPLPTGILGI